MSRLADIGVAIQEWVFSAVQTPEMAAALGLALPAQVGPRTWDSTPPPDADMPFLEVVVAEPRDVGGIGGSSWLAVAEVTVKVVARAEAYEPIRAAGVAIHHALQVPAGPSIPLNGGGELLSSVRLRTVMYPEQSEGIEYRHLGGTYQVNAQ